MIAFSCTRCTMRFQVKDEFAGRSIRCPTCKNPLTVPPPPATLALPSHFDGPLSSLARAGIPCDVTLAGSPPASSGKAPGPVAAVIAAQQSDGQRYLLEGEIARGGMGAVLRAVDCDIRREVAVKYLLDQADPRKKVRFVEEAQVTGQLEHPNIVPIHELGVDGQGRLFFAMKMVRGRSLQEVLQELRDSPRSAGKEYPLGRLLTVFVSACNALAYAHSRSVVHRDLKPANIMVGDFGEVYVMDWGLAKILDRPAPEPTAVIQSTPSFAWAEGVEAGESNTPSVQTSRQDGNDRTMDGAILGTPQYMPPEQALGQMAAIDPRSDVYALGAILYEMLTLQPPINQAGGATHILARVIKGEIVPPEKLAPGRHIPAELSAVALKALAKEPRDRYPGVEALRRDIERYQEGRSVSAREDTKWEMARKFVRRNKGFSAGMAAALLVLLGSLWFIGRAWLRADAARRKAEDNYAAYQKEQREKQVIAARAVPALVEAARLAAQEHHFADALTQLDLAQSYDRDYAPIELVRGQVLAGKLQFREAAEAVRQYLKRRPGDADASELERLLAGARAEDGERLLELAGVLVRQKALGPANVLLGAAGKLVKERRKLLPRLKQ
jgi:serine/threonine protein kinase